MLVDSAETVGATAPVHDLGLVDLKTVVVLGFKTWRSSDSAIDVED